MEQSANEVAAFLADFRALRKRSSVDFAELAARAHYPVTLLKAAEQGPGLPSLPVLAGFVRGCNGDVTAWEERWHAIQADMSVPRAVVSTPLAGGALAGGAELPARTAGASQGATAGARAKTTLTTSPDCDPGRIREILRNACAEPGDTEPGTQAELTGHASRTGHPGTLTMTAGPEAADAPEPAADTARAGRLAARLRNSRRIRRSLRLIPGAGSLLRRREASEG